MPVTIIYAASAKHAKKKKGGHTKAQAPSISLDQPGRLRVAHVMSVLAVSHSRLYEGIKKGAYPKPDGRDGRNPYWFTSTIRGLIQP